MRRLIPFALVPFLAACGGSGSERFYFGATFVEPDNTGAVANIDASDLSLVQRGINGFVYGFVDNVDATRVGSSAGARAGDRGSFAVAGLLPTTDVGAPITSGSAILAGEYAAVKITGTERTPDSSQWEVEELSGAFQATISLKEDEADPLYDDPYRLRELVMTGMSDDARLVIPESVIADLTSGEDGRDPERSQSINLVLDGITYSTRSEIAVGRSALIGAFTGQEANVMLAGGLALGG